MEITELRPQVAEALVLAMDGNLSKRRSQEILTTVLAFLDGQAEANQQRQETADAASAVRVARAVKSLSYSETEAIMHVFRELDGNKGLLVASKIADRIGVTRSVIVNALRKLESAGMVKSRSLGMKGTYIEIIHPEIVDLIEKAA